MRSSQPASGGPLRITAKESIMNDETFLHSYDSYDHSCSRDRRVGFLVVALILLVTSSVI